MATISIKGCDAKYINDLVMQKIRGVKDEIINNNISLKTMSIVNNYDIQQCMQIILKQGVDFHDIYVKLQSMQDVEIDTSDKLKFHRHIALIYVKQLILKKYNTKLQAHICKASVAAKTAECSICLQKITSDAQITRCHHAFHRACMIQWGRPSCPLCRANV